MTYEEARAYNEEAEELRRLIYEEGLLVATARVHVSHTEEKSELAGIIASEVESTARNWEAWCVTLTCKVCHEEVQPEHTCIDGPISKDQLHELRGHFPGWRWPRKAKSATPEAKS